MMKGFRMCTNWKIAHEKPELPVEEILDMVSDTVVEMAIENGKMARTLHEVANFLFENSSLSLEKSSFLRNIIIENLGITYAGTFSKEEHKN